METRSCSLLVLFQSTRPARGATDQSASYCVPDSISIHAPREGRDFILFLLALGLMISIHAPREGRDLRMDLHDRLIQEFQSTRPARGATEAELDMRHADEFQSTRPARGATMAAPWRTWTRWISIHAPREGRDELALLAGIKIKDFNPRAPRGARPPGPSCISTARKFQSTRPARGATWP